MLHGVVVVSPALPQVRFEQERMRLYFEERYGRGFEYAYVIPGMTRVVQSAGRVIRSETDVGVIALVCRRFLQNPYRKFLPSHWYDESPGELACLSRARLRPLVLRKGRRDAASRLPGRGPVAPARARKKERPRATAGPEGPGRSLSFSGRACCC